MRLIDADALKNVIHWLNDCSRLGILAAIDKLPTVDAVERKKGKWIPVTNGRGGYCCELCNRYAPSYRSGEEHLSSFCPNCGAEMRGEANE